MSTDLFDQNGAVFSENRKYRYALWRDMDWEEKNAVMFIGLNPSTANEFVDDRTIGKVRRFSKTWGYKGVIMMNCFPFISTDPDKLNDTGMLMKNLEQLIRFKQFCPLVIFAWGNFKIVTQTGQDQKMMQRFPDAFCLGKNRNGSPKHPLYLGKSTQLIKFQGDIA
jgi:hypothetical protein